MKTEHYFYDGAVCRYEYAYPSDCELLEIFPEAGEIVPGALKDARAWYRRIYRAETVPYFRKVGLLRGDFKRAFWSECYRYLASGWAQALAEVDRLERLQAILEDPDGYKLREGALDRARTAQVETLHHFEGMRRSRGGWSARCPLHGDKDPSFKWYEDTRSWYCFGCGKGGDAVRFVMLLYGIGFRKAVALITKGRT